MTFLSKEQILERRALPLEDVAVPEWSGAVRVQGLSSADGDKFLASLNRQNGQKIERDTTYYCAKLLALCLVNEQGERLLTEADVLALAQQSNAVVMRLADIAQRLSGLQPGSVEAAAKN